MKRIDLSGNDILELDLIQANAGNLETLEIYQTYPLANHPRRQRILQVTASPVQLWEMASWLHEALNGRAKRC